MFRYHSTYNSKLWKGAVAKVDIPKVDIPKVDIPKVDILKVDTKIALYVDRKGVGY